MLLSLEISHGTLYDVKLNFTVSEKALSQQVALDTCFEEGEELDTHALRVGVIYCNKNSQGYKSLSNIFYLVNKFLEEGPTTLDFQSEDDSFIRMTFIYDSCIYEWGINFSKFGIKQESFRVKEADTIDFATVYRETEFEQRVPILRTIDEPHAIAAYEWLVDNFSFLDSYTQFTKEQKEDDGNLNKTVIVKLDDNLPSAILQAAFQRTAKGLDSHDKPELYYTQIFFVSSSTVTLNEVDLAATFFIEDTSAIQRADGMRYIHMQQSLVDNPMIIESSRIKNLVAKMTRAITFRRKKQNLLERPK